MNELQVIGRLMYPHLDKPRAPIGYEGQAKYFTSLVMADDDALALNDVCYKLGAEKFGPMRQRFRTPVRRDEDKFGGKCFVKVSSIERPALTNSKGLTVKGDAFEGNQLVEITVSPFTYDVKGDLYGVALGLVAVKLLADRFEDVLTLPSGFKVYREPGLAGGYRYWSDEVAGGVMVWDTSLVGADTLGACVVAEAR